MDMQILINASRKAREQAYCPYSKFAVGAALLAGDRIYTGCNVENASYGLTVCAERVAVFKAISEGEHRFKALCLCGSGKGFTYPCGACLQVLAEFEKELKIIVIDEKEGLREHNLQDLMPYLFVMDVEGK